MKISYSTMPNMKRIIAGHNKKILNPENQLKREDCDGKGGCKDKCIEEERSCQTKQVIYTKQNSNKSYYIDGKVRSLNNRGI